MHENKNHDHSSHLQIWFCEHCNNVHFKTSNITMDFSKEEFLELSKVMHGILRTNFSDDEQQKVLSYELENDDVLLSDTVI